MDDDDAAAAAEGEHDITTGQPHVLHLVST